MVSTAAGVVLALGLVDSGFASGEDSEQHPKVLTDGRLRPGHLETIGVVGFPGKGTTEVAIFPSAICEDACGARSFFGGRTNAEGAARFQVRVPGTFFDHRNRFVYFRDGERIDIQVIWNGPGRSGAVATADPQPIIVEQTGDSMRLTFARASAIVVA